MTPGAAKALNDVQPPPTAREREAEQEADAASIEEAQSYYYLSVIYPDAATAKGAYREITSTLSGSSASIVHLADPDSDAQMIVIIAETEGLLEVIARKDVLGLEARDWKPDPALLEELSAAHFR